MVSHIEHKGEILHEQRDLERGEPAAKVPRVIDYSWVFEELRETDQLSDEGRTH